MNTDNPYLKPIHSVLPRLLALYDTNPAGSTCGVGDRFYWAWSLIDFANATIQGSVNGLARLIRYDLLPDYLDKQSILIRIDSIILGACSLLQKNGSVNQAFPYEGSYCGTALVAYDILCAIDLLENELSTEDKQKYFNIIRPMIQYLINNDETHGFISNHLAVVAASLFKWTKLTLEPGEEKATALLNQILEKQSPEGWYKEYDGADPGYQTLCMVYLADIVDMCPHLSLVSSVENAINFLSHFVHPDGSFGGVYGSRNTRFYFPAGIEYFSSKIPLAHGMATFLRNSVKHFLCPGLECMDTPNLVPMFNAYCWAASLYQKESVAEQEKLPCFSVKPFQLFFKESGLLIHRGINTYTIVSTHKGGVVYHYLNSRLAHINSGLLLKNNKNNYFTNQIHQQNNDVTINGNQVIIKADIKPVRCILPKPWQFGILRLLNVSVMRIPYFREKIKQILAYLLITAKGKTYGCITRKITIAQKVEINDQINVDKALSPIKVTHPFTAIHMASQGYWQRQDDQQHPNERSQEYDLSNLSS